MSKHQNDKKSQYYQKIKQDYERERLPEIHLQRQLLDQRKVTEQEEGRKKQALARQNTKRAAHVLSQQFQQQVVKHKQDEQQ